ncbi:hypothetical protein D3C80_2073470 [compost metagenome]
MWDPIYPAPPVTKIAILLHSFQFFYTITDAAYIKFAGQAGSCFISFAYFADEAFYIVFMNQ